VLSYLLFTQTQKDICTRPHLKFTVIDVSIQKMLRSRNSDIIEDFKHKIVVRSMYIPLIGTKL